MTRPPDPGHPYGPPPPRPGPRPQPPGPPPQGWSYDGALERDAATKGFFGSLLDVNFNYLVTPKLIKLFFVSSLVLIGLQSLLMLIIGLKVASWDDGWAWGVMLIIATPFVWLFEVVLVRIFMEAMVIRFKGVEYLRIMKDRDMKDRDGTR
jgi:hypothetical protein